MRAQIFIPLAILAFLILSNLEGNAQVPAYVPTSGLVAWYPFSGNANDSSGNGYNGTDYGASLTTDRFGIAGKAYDFNGSSNYISTTASFPTGASAKSYSIWFKADSIKRGWILAGGLDNPGQAFGLFMQDASGAVLFHGMSTYDIIVDSIFDTTSWHHFVITFQSDTIKFYSNGILTASYYDNLSTASSNIIFGRRENPALESGTDAYFKGKIDDIGIWNRALTPCEVYLLYRSSIATGLAGTITGSSTVNIGYPITLTDTISGGTWSSTNISIATVGSTGIITGLTTGIDTIKYTVTNVCGSAVATKVMTINPTTINAPCYVPSLGLVAWYPFTGTAIDSSGHGNNLSNVGGVSYSTDRFGNSSSTASFDGTGQNLQILNPGFATGNSERSISLWYKLYSCSHTSMPTLFDIQEGAGGGYCNTSFTLYADTENYYFAGRCNDRSDYFSPLNHLNSWYHIVLVYRNNKILFYQNTLLLNDTTNPYYAFTTLLNTLNHEFSVGAPGVPGVWSPINGLIDDIAVYNRALSPCEISQLYYASCTPAGTITGPLVLCVGSTVTLTDTISGGTWSSSNTASASVGSTGVVTGVTAGVDTIKYTVNNVCGTVTSKKIITVNPLPIAGLIAGSSSLCSGSNLTLTDTTSGGTWSSSNTAIATVGSTGIVTGVSAGTATISYTKTNVCGSASSTKAVTINPIPLLSSTLTPPAICNGTLFSYTPASSVTGVTFAWSRATVSGISNPASSGTGNIIETLVNTTPSPVNVTYVYTLSASGCSNAQNVIVIVNPTPMLSSALTPPSICSGTLFSYSPVSATTGVSFAWSRSSIAGISNPAATGTGNINETLFNTTSSPVTVTYRYTLTVYGCLNVQNVTVTVNPLPNAGTISGASTLCTGATTAYTDASPGGLWSSTNGNASLSGIGIATGITAGTDTIEYIVINTCGTATAAKAVTVNSSPSAGTITGGSLVCVGSTMPLSDATTGGIWSSLSTAIATVGSSGIVSGVSAGTATIIYTISNTCGSVFASHIITVNPLPVANTITGASTVCAGSNITLTDAVTGGVWSATNSNAFVSSGGIVNGIIAGSDTIKYTVTNTCGTASASKTITINPLPIAGSISGLSSVCRTAFITLTDGAPGGTWTALNGNATVLAGVVTGVAAGADTILYTVTNSCGAASAYQFITINPLPVSGGISGSATLCVGSSATLSDSIIGGSWSATNSNALVSSGGIVYAMVAGVDTIAYTVTNSCGNAIAVHAITINPLPNAGIISGTSTVCIGTPDTLSDPVAGGAWSATNSCASVLAGIITGAVTGMDTIVYTVSNACGSASKSKIISINPMPNAGTISGKDTVCMETTITLAESATGGSWSTVLGNAAVSTTGVVIGVNYGLDTVLYTVTNSCGTAVAKMPVQILQSGECISGLSIINSEASLMVIPNPNKGVFTIKGTIGTTADEQVTIEVINLLGQVVYRSQVMMENGKLDERVQLGSSLANGMYLLSLKSASENKVFHIVIEQ